MAEHDDPGDEQKALEEALPSLLDKLGELRADLPEGERVVLDEIIVSASRHTEAIEADDITEQGTIRYFKPMSVHVTAQMREEMIEMPKRYGISED
jgi:hypothetical protein